MVAGSATLLAVPGQAGLAVPPGSWGNTQGGISILIQNFSGVSDWVITQGGPSTVIGSAASNNPPNSLTPYNGQGGGKVTSYVDQNGAHIYAEGSATGESSTAITAHSGFSDTLTNNNNFDVQFQLTFHLDATLYTNSSARDTLALNFYWNGFIADSYLNDQILNGAGTLDVINQDFISQTYTIAPNSTFTWGIEMAAFVGVSSKANRTYLAGLPFGYLDALNTLTVTNLQTYDALGAGISNNALSSGSGFQYSGAATPEPATWLATGPVLAIALILRRRARRTPAPPA